MLVQLHHPSGEPVWVNPAHVITLEPSGQGDGTFLYFGLAGRFWSGDSSGETEPFRVNVQETPARVVILLHAEGRPLAKRPGLLSGAGDPLLLKAAEDAAKLLTELEIRLEDAGAALPSRHHEIRRALDAATASASS